MSTTTLSKLQQLALLVASSALFAVVSSVSSSAMGIVHCAGTNSSQLGDGPYFTSGIKQIDPIANRGSVMSMHEHQFFGAMVWDDLAEPHNADYDDLVDADTSCDITVDSAAYWAPTVRKTSADKALLPIKRQEAYYRSWDGKLTDTKRATTAFPPDMRMIAGNNMAMSIADWNKNYVAWSCGNLSTKAQRTGTHAAGPTEADCSTARNYNDATKNDRVFLTVSIKFPTCWDGKMNNHRVAGNTADFSGDPMSTIKQHVVYRTRTGCPATHPRKIPELSFVTSWDYRGNGKDIKLSSGMGTAAGKGYTYHADFWNTWNQAGLQRMINTCINTSKTDAYVHLNNADICGRPVIMTPPGA